MTPATVTLKPNRERPVENGNPWVFSGAVARIAGYSTAGQPCEIVAADGRFLAAGYVNRDSRITCRVLSRERVAMDESLIRDRIARSFDRRAGILDDDTTACRLVNSEGDFLPGLIVDTYGDGVVVQILTSGMERFREAVIGTISELRQPAFIAERSDVAARADEGLPQTSGVLAGVVDGPVEIREHGLRFLVDVRHGQKTGFFLDQRDSRFLIRRYARNKRVANLFAYTGGFSVAAAAAGAAEVLSVDSSGPALDLARRNMELNAPETPAGYDKADVFAWLGEHDEQWDIIVLDPPAFATKKSAVERAARGYKDLNLRALKRLAPGGLLFTYSCSHHIDPTLFRQIVYAAAADAGVDAQVIAQTGHPADHPFNICHIEGEYLKGLVLRLGGGQAI